MMNLNEMKSNELKAMARDLGVKNWWNMNKAALIAAIEEMQNAPVEEEQIEERTPAITEEPARDLEVEYEEQVKQENEEAVSEETTEEQIEEEQNNEEIQVPEKPEDWAERKYKAYVKHFHEEFIPDGGNESEIELDMKDFSDDYDEDHKKEKKEKAPVKKENLKLKELTFNGKTQSIKEWAAEMNMPVPTLYDRVNRNGWTVEEALTIPLGGKRKK